MNEFSNETSRPAARNRARLGRHMHHHHHRHHRFADCGPEARRGAGRQERGERQQRGERMHAVREFHRALANVARSGSEQVRDEAAQIVAEATSRLNGLLGAER
jgi:hypothetical protein